jgi:hypothetical protein
VHAKERGTWHVISLVEPDDVELGLRKKRGSPGCWKILINDMTILTLLVSPHVLGSLGPHYWHYCCPC